MRARAVMPDLLGALQNALSKAVSPILNPRAEVVADADGHLAVPREPSVAADAVALDALLGQLDLSQFLRIAAGICDALSVLHEAGGVHNDLKPSNILVSPSSGRAWLSGARPASLAAEPRPPQRKSSVTSGLAYLAPERTGRLSSPVDCRADLYSLGVALYQAATDRLPFAINEPGEWMHAHVAARPAPPAEGARLPGTLQRILLRLLEKDPDHRYQTASGLAHDLRECLRHLDETGGIGHFPLGRRDRLGHLSRRVTFRGRVRELELLSSAVERVQRTGVAEILLIAGHSGIGKSSLASELLGQCLPSGALAVSGKSGELGTDAPHATLMQAFREICRWILAKHPADLNAWKGALLHALGTKVGAVVELIPELGWIIGQQPRAEPLPVEEARNFVFGSFRQLLRAVTERQRPLILFLDDLQWLDPAALSLLEHLFLDPELNGVLLLGAYRSEAVAAQHPLLEAMGRLRSAGRSVQTLPLGPLPSSDVGQLVADVLLSVPEQTAELSRLVEKKTAGNPFFVRQFLTALTEEQLIRFDPQRTVWAWEPSRILAKGPTDNLAELLLDRLARLPAATQRALETLACLGVRVPLAVLGEVSSVPPHVIRGALLPAMQVEVIVGNEDGYAFVHDRLLASAYSRIPEAQRAARHLELGRALRERKDVLRGDHLFEVVRHLNLAVDQICDPHERIELAKLNLEFARRSRATAACANARPYLELAWSLLPTNHWQSHRALSFDLALARAESEFLSGERCHAEALLADLAGRPLNAEQAGAVVCVQLPLYLTSNRAMEAVELGLAYLQSCGSAWQVIDDTALQLEYERFRRVLGERSVAELADLPPMSSGSARVTMEVCAALVSPAYFSDQRLFSLLTLHMASSSIENGNCEGSAFAYGLLCMVLGPYFQAHDLGLEFGLLGSQLAELDGNRFAARAWLVMGALVAPRTIDAHAGHSWLVRACQASERFGDLLYGVYTKAYVVTSLLGSGAALAEAERQADTAIAHSRRYQFALIADRICVLRALIRGLRTPGWDAGSLSDEELDEERYEQSLGDGPDRYYYWVRRTQARYYVGDFAAARQAARRARQLIWTSPFFPEEIDLWVFGALAEAASAGAGDTSEALEIIAGDERELNVWAERCPATFASKAALVSGERSRLLGRSLEAEQRYEQAADLARQYGLVHEEALAHELSARQYAQRGIHSVARFKLAAARACYSQWGALGKVSQLDSRIAVDGAATVARELTHSLEQADAHVLLSALQAVSSSLDLGQLLGALMKAALQQAAAERGVVVLHAREPRIRARATCECGAIQVSLDELPMSPELLPESIARYVLHSSARLFVRDGTLPSAFHGDPYFKRTEVCALLCLPLMARGETIGALYLESTLTRQAFSARGLAAVELIATQAASSLENARLYADLRRARERMARAEHLSRTASFIWRRGGQELEWSEEVSKIYGIEGRPSMKQLSERTHPEDRALFDAIVNGSESYDGQTAELRLRMPDGAVKHITVIASRLTADEFVATIRDVTDNKQTEEALQRTQAALTDMTRVASLGELAAAIAHEVNQPLSAVGLNASTCLRWLEEHNVNLIEAREAAVRIRRDANRAAAVVQRLRALFSKSEGVKAVVDLNDAVTEVAALLRSRIRAAGATLRLRLQEGLPPVLGDRVQLQQVLMNLLINALESVKSEGERSREIGVRTLLADARWVRCEVQDSGRGVPEQDNTRIFEPFYTTKPDGMGIGLSICKNIVWNHGGELSVRSGVSSPGATFCFTLPLHEPS